MQRPLRDWHLLLAAPVGWGGGLVEGDSGKREGGRTEGWWGGVGLCVCVWGGAGRGRSSGDKPSCPPCPSDNKESEWCLSENQEPRSPLFWCEGHLGCGSPSALAPQPRGREAGHTHRSRAQDKQMWVTRPAGIPRKSPNRRGIQDARGKTRGLSLASRGRSRIAQRGLLRWSEGQKKAVEVFW